MSGKLAVGFIYHRKHGKKKKEKLWASSYTLNNAAMRGLGVLMQYGMPGDVIEYIDRQSPAQPQIAVHKIHANGRIEFEFNRIYVDEVAIPATLLRKSYAPEPETKDGAKVAETTALQPGQS